MAALPQSPGREGFGCIRVGLECCRKLDIPVLAGHRVVRIVRGQPDAGRVPGVEAGTKEGRQFRKAEKGVAAAAGGFAANAPMCALSDPGVVNLSTASQPGATGGVPVALQDVGVLATCHGCIQCIPEPAPGLRKSGALCHVIEYCIFFNREGKRYVAEGHGRDVIRDATLLQADQYVFGLVCADGPAASNRYQLRRSGQCLEEGCTLQAYTAEGIAEKVGVPAGILKATVGEYSRQCDTGVAPPRQAGRDHDGEDCEGSPSARLPPAWPATSPWAG